MINLLQSNDQTDDHVWIQFNYMTHCYESKDGTVVASELVDNVECLADVLYIAKIKESQRTAMSNKC
jgi:hypothetical protein